PGRSAGILILLLRSGSEHAGKQVLARIEIRERDFVRQTVSRKVGGISVGCRVVNILRASGKSQLVVVGFEIGDSGPNPQDGFGGELISDSGSRPEREGIIL